MTGRFLKCDKPPQFRLKPEIYFKIEEVGDILVLNEFTYNYYQRNE